MKNKNIFYSMAEEDFMKTIKFVLTFFILLSLMAIVFPFTPRAVQADDETYYYDFIANANEANWSSGAGNLPFSGEIDDSRGFACYRLNIKGEDGVTYDKVLETYPQWVDNGYISGIYPEITVMSGTALYLRVGFLEGAAGTDGVTFEVRLYHVGGIDPIGGWPVATINGQYDGIMQLSYYPLDHHAGETVKFQLVVRAGPSSDKDWAIWTEAKIMPRGVIITTDCPLPDATRGTAYSVQLEAVGGELPYVWSRVDGSLPTGLSLNSATGIISGTPTTTGTYSFRLKACDSTPLDGPSCTAPKDCYIRVIAPGETPPVTPIFDFNLSVSPAEITINLDPLVSGTTCTAEAQTTATISLVFAGAVAQTVNLSLSGVPDHVLSSCLPRDGLPPFTSQCGFTVYCTETLPAVGDYSVNLTATGGGFNRTRTIRLHIVREVYGDLDIVSLEPVQVIYGVQLIAGKGTVFRVKVNSTFSLPVETELRLMLPDNEWDIGIPYLPPGMMPPDWEYPEVWGPVQLSPGENEIILPIVSPGQENADFDPTLNPAGIIRGVYGTRGELHCYKPDIRVVPRPIATPGVEEWQTVHFTVEVNPERNIDETDEGNNEYHGSEYVVITRGYSFAVFRIMTIAGAPSWENANRDFKNNLEYLLGTFPIADSKIYYSIMPTIVSAELDGAGRDACLRSIYRMAASEHYDWAVGVAGGCCGGTFPWDMKSVYIGNVTAEINNLAHEASHITSVVDAPDCYDCALGDASCASCRSNEGFWVNAWQKYPRETPPSDWNVTASGNWSTNEWLRLCYYMDFSNYAPYCWTRLDPVRHNDGSLYTDGYRNLIGVVYALRDPEGLLVSGTVDQDNTIILDPFIRISDATLDIEPGNKGDYYIVLLDINNRILSKSGFFVSFYETAKQPDSGMVKIDKTGFAYVIEWKDETKRIEIQDKDGSVLASRDVSLNKPEIKVLYPNGGEVFAINETMEIGWQASDGDGDALTYSLAISMDSGETWLPIDIDITGNKYQLDTGLLEVGQDYLVKVRATDGVNTAEDISDGAFTITKEGEPETEPGGCFIATAAYGTPMAEEIEILREFRDEYLLTNPLGQALTDLYYRVSPPIAEFITEHPSLKPIVRAGLVPAVAMSAVAINTTTGEKMAMAGLLVLVSVAVAVWMTRRRGRRVA